LRLEGHGQLSAAAELLIRSIVWSLLIRLVGGLFPAVRAARLSIASALREP
jgi:putative ABC transport system permease protein